MQHTAQPDEILVRKNKPLYLHRPAIIRCTAGMVWITSTGKSEDIFLTAGQSHLSRGRGLTLIEGVEEGWIHLENDKRAALRPRCQDSIRKLWRKMLSRTGRAASAPSWYA